MTKLLSQAVNFLKLANSQNYIKVMQILPKLKNDGLVFIPAIVSVLNDMSIGEVHNALLRGYKEGLIELQPESGIGRLNERQKAKCIKGIMGTWLSWVRILDENAIKALDDNKTTVLDNPNQAYQLGLRDGLEDIENEQWGDARASWHSMIEFYGKQNQLEDWMHDYENYRNGYRDALKK